MTAIHDLIERIKKKKSGLGKGQWEKFKWKCEKKVIKNF